MPTTLITGLTATVGGGGNVDVRPPVGQAWKITDVCSDAVFVTNVPDVEVRLRNAVTADAIVCLDPTTDPGRRTHQLELYITNTTWMRLINTGAAGSELGHFGYRVNVNTAVAAVVACGIGATIFIQPPAGQTWVITNIGSEIWQAAAANEEPDIAIGITNGVLVASLIIDPDNVRGQDKKYAWYINNMVYLAVTNENAAANAVGYSGYITEKTAIGSIQDVVGSATLDIRPPAGQEWVITEIAAETWAGGGVPNNYPDVLVSLMVGANLADLLEAGSVATSIRWNSEMELHVDNTNWLRITEVSAANNEIGVLGYLKRTYSA
jgi:hypothetical protein